MEDPIPLTDAQILAHVDSLLASQKGGQKWDQEVHCFAIAKVAKQCGTDYRKLVLTLAQHGLGGNTSQFRQWLESPPPKGPARLKAAADIAKAYDV